MLDRGYGERISVKTQIKTKYYEETKWSYYRVDVCSGNLYGYVPRIGAD